MPSFRLRRWEVTANGYRIHSQLLTTMIKVEKGHLRGINFRQFGWRFLSLLHPLQMVWMTFECNPTECFTSFTACDNVSPHPVHTWRHFVCVFIRFFQFFLFFFYLKNLMAPIRTENRRINEKKKNWEKSDRETAKKLNISTSSSVEFFIWFDRTHRQQTKRRAYFLTIFCLLRFHCSLSDLTDIYCQFLVQNDFLFSYEVILRCDRDVLFHFVCCCFLIAWNICENRSFNATNQSKRAMNECRTKWVQERKR